MITETARTRAATKALRSRAWAQLGTLFTASHLSLRDDYEVSAPELDIAVDAALEADALGARMTGGGFGGSIIALVAAKGVDAVVARASRRRSPTTSSPRLKPLSSHPQDGARRL
ncbi:MAG: hypothetical protein WKF83_13830 [Nocardioidaceae bacterium]